MTANLRPWLRAHYWIIACRMAVFGNLIYWLMNLKVAGKYYHFYLNFPLQDSFFPGFQQVPVLVLVYFCTPMISGLPVMFLPSRGLIILHGVLLAICSWLLLTHQGAFMSQGTNITFWSGILLIWMGWHTSKAGKTTAQKAHQFPILVQWLVSFIFLGGAVGKLTGGYLDGSILANLSIPRAHVYDVFFFLKPETVSLWSSRLCVFGEMGMAVSFLLPTRLAFPLMVSFLGGMIFIMNYTVLDALGSLLGMVLAGWLAAVHTSGNTVTN